MKKLILSVNMLLIVGLGACLTDSRYWSLDGQSFYSQFHYFETYLLIIYILLVIGLMSYILDKIVSKKVLIFLLILNLPLIIPLWALGMDILFRMIDCCYIFPPTLLTYVSQVTIAISGVVNIFYLSEKLAKNHARDASI